MFAFSEHKNTASFSAYFGLRSFLADRAPDPVGGAGGLAERARLHARIAAARETLQKQGGLSRPAGAMNWSNWMNR